MVTEDGECKQGMKRRARLASAVRGKTAVDLEIKECFNIHKHKSI